MFTIGDKTIEAKIKEKEEAKQQYSDAIAAGKAAVFAQEKQNEVVEPERVNASKNATW